MSRILVWSLMLGVACGCGSSSDNGGGGGSSGTGTGGGSASGAGGSAGSGAGGSGGDSGMPSNMDAGLPLFDAGGSNTVTAGNVCVRLATIQCAGEQHCCKSPGRDFAACEKAAEDSCKNTALFDMLSEDPAVGFDANAASTAFAELEHRASTCDPSVAAWAVSPDGFESSFTGTLGAGDDCTPPGGLSMASVHDLAVSLVSCRLGDGLACLPADPTWMCAQRAARGGRCFTDLNCQDGLYCDNPNSTFMGMCAPRKSAGAACQNDSECDSFTCTSKSCVSGDDVQAAYCLK